MSARLRSFVVRLRFAHLLAGAVALAGVLLFGIGGFNRHQPGQDLHKAQQAPLPSWPHSNELVPAAGHVSSASIAVRFRAGTSIAVRKQLLARYGATTIGSLPQLHLEIVRVATARAAATLKQLDSSPAVSAAAPDQVRQIAGGTSSSALTSPR